MNAMVEIPITEEIHGKPVKAYQEKDGRISITYEDHCWWFYQKDEDGEVVWE